MNTAVHPPCACCGFTYGGKTCPRCGYPLDPIEEEQFLWYLLNNLERVARFGNPDLSIKSLIANYRQRLSILRQVNAPSVIMQPPVVSQPVVQPVIKEVEQASSRPSINAIAQPVPTPQPERLAVSASVQPERHEPKKSGKSFSFKDFFADQTINIVASLGAFLILIGSLSFIVTTPNLLFSFLVLLAVHFIFGITGIISYRFQSFRIVAVIYSAIFALQVPLVGYAGYQLFAGTDMQLSPPVLVAIAAAYAAITYGSLAIYQKFAPFAYLAVVSLAVVDLALCYAAELAIWWWPGMLMLLALPILGYETHTTIPPRLLSGAGALLRRPLRLLMQVAIVSTMIALVAVYAYSLNQDALGESHSDIRWSLVFMLVLCLGGLCLFAWRTRKWDQLVAVPYIGLLSLLALAYALFFTQEGYALALIGVAVLYHGVRRLPTASTALPGLQRHLDGLVLLLIVVIPLVVAPQLPFVLFTQIYAPETLQAYMQAVVSPIGMGILLVALILSLSMIGVLTGWRRVLEKKQAGRCQILLISGYLLYWLFGSIVLTLHFSPLWSFFACSICLLVLAVVVRRQIGVVWASPIELVAVGAVALALSLSVWEVATVRSLLFLFFAGSSYGIAFYQRRSRLFWGSLLLFLLTCFPLVEASRLTLVLGWGMPLLTTGVFLLIMYLGKDKTTLAVHFQPTRRRHTLYWIWPLLVASIVYGIVLAVHSIARMESIGQAWTGLTVPVALELAVLAALWYGVAACMRTKELLLVMSGFGIAALLVPTTPFTVLVGIAPALALLALLISLRIGKGWALPFYMLALLAGGMMGYVGYQGQSLQAATWALLLFAPFIYLVGVFERNRIIQWVLLWSAAGFASWSVYNAGLLGDHLRPPTVALVCSAIGVSIGCLRFWFPARREKLRFYVWPFYATAIVAAIFTGLYGTLGGNIHVPFYAAVPSALLMYALVAYGILLFERYAHGLWLVAVFAVWGVVLMVGTNFYYIAAVGLLIGTSGLLWSRMTRILFTRVAFFTPLIQNAQANVLWSWPWYLAALVSASLLVVWPLLPLQQSESLFRDYCLLVFAALAYAIAVVEGRLNWTWVGVSLATLSLLRAAVEGNVYHLGAVALVCTAGGLLTFGAVRLASLLAIPIRPQDRRAYALPFYAVAVAAALLTGLRGLFPGWMHLPFAEIIALSMFLYAALVYLVAVLERRGNWLWLVIGFALWGTMLRAWLPVCGTPAWSPLTGCDGVLIVRIAAVGVCAVFALVCGRLMRSNEERVTWRTYFAWNWPLYALALLTTFGMIGWVERSDVALSAFYVPIAGSALILIWLLVLWFERVPEFLLVSVAMTLWTFTQMGWQNWQVLGACSLLGIAIVASAYIWKIRRPVFPYWSFIRVKSVLGALGIVGQGLLILAIMFAGGLLPGNRPLADIGAGVVCVLAVMSVIFTRRGGSLEAFITREQQRLFLYIAGALLAFAASWEMLAWGVTHASLLAIPPASYLIVVSPFLMEDKQVARAKDLGHLCALAGALLLLTPSIWLSLSQASLLATSLLAGEALLLFLIGIGLRMRFLILGGAGLVIASAIHLLFLPELNLSRFLALTITGVILLGAATGLVLVRTRLWPE